MSDIVCPPSFHKAEDFCLETRLEQRRAELEELENAKIYDIEESIEFAEEGADHWVFDASKNDEAEDSESENSQPENQVCMYPPIYIYIYLFSQRSDCEEMPNKRARLDDLEVQEDNETHESTPTNSRIG